MLLCAEFGNGRSDVAMRDAMERWAVALRSIALPSSIHNSDGLFRPSYLSESVI